MAPPWIGEIRQTSAEKTKNGSSGVKQAMVIGVVDDDEAVRAALCDLLLALGYHPRTFGSAEAFLERMSEERFDCLITDIRMPGMDGLDLLQRLRSAGSALPVIIITSSTEPALRNRARALGAGAYLVKPVSEQVLVGQLSTLLTDGATGSEADGREDGDDG